MAQLFGGRGQQKVPQGKHSSETQILPETMWAKEPMPSGIPPQGSVVVTIARQFGSGGSEIGHMLAEESELNYVDQGIIDEVARRLGVNVQQVARQDEQTTGVVGHILEAIR